MLLKEQADSPIDWDGPCSDGRDPMLASTMRMTTPKQKKLEQNSELVRIDEEWQDAISKGLKKKRSEDGWPKKDQRPHPDPRSIEVEDS